MRPSQAMCAMVVVASAPLSPVSAFSAQLPHPWEHPSSKTTGRKHRRRRWHSLHGTSELLTHDGKDSDGNNDEASSLQTDEEDTTPLGNNEDPEHNVIIADAHSPLSSPAPSQTVDHPPPTVRSSLRLLFGMTRPSNFPGVVLLHILGTYLALQSPLIGTAQLWPTLARPSMMIVLFCLHLTSAASMVVNDYFDNQIGVDKDIRKPLVGGTVTMAVTKQFLYYIYAILALCMTAVPGVLARLMVVIGNMLTYWYTKHIKPRTWWKNVVCASIMGLSPVTSAAAAFSLSSTQNALRVFGVSALSRLVVALFAGFTGREILMDINDVQDDTLLHVRTVPVAYGRKFASKVALACTAAMTGCAVMGPIYSLGKSLSSSLSLEPLLSTLHSSPGGATRQLILALLGCLPMLYRAWDVYKTEGEDRRLVDQAVDEGKLTFMLILASFV